MITLESAKEVLGDAVCRVLSNEARKFADAGHSPRSIWRTSHRTWFDEARTEMKKVVWRDTYYRRRARIKRMS